jgi:hypothetical protein
MRLRPESAASEQGDRTNRLYQWLAERASFFRSDTPGRNTIRTVRTKVTVERQAITLLVGSPSTHFDVCPLCGQKRGPGHAEQAGQCLLEGSISQEPDPVDQLPPPRIDGGATK